MFFLVEESVQYDEQLIHKEILGAQPKAGWNTQPFFTSLPIKMQLQTKWRQEGIILVQRLVIKKQNHTTKMYATITTATMLVLVKVMPVQVFFMLILLWRTSFFTTFYGLYFSSLHIISQISCWVFEDSFFVCTCLIRIYVKQ